MKPSVSDMIRCRGIIRRMSEREGWVLIGNEMVGRSDPRATKHIKILKNRLRFIRHPSLLRKAIAIMSTEEMFNNKTIRKRLSDPELVMKLLGGKKDSGDEVDVVRERLSVVAQLRIMSMLISPDIEHAVLSHLEISDNSKSGGLL
ncbi:MAG: hypothetical protein D6732_23345 [Methanobacteriota archaeon]|nr:MAG: hypothetical protein D6732_23345 [Euryarchaeota archaeon]